MSIEMEILEIIARSITVSGGATLLASLWGLPLGILIGLKTFRGRSILKGYFKTMMGMPTVSLGLILWIIFSRSGPLGFLRLMHTPMAIIFGQAVLVTPIIVSLVANIVESVNPEIRDLAKTLGASETQASMAVLRESINGVVLTIIVGFNRAISELGVALMVGGNIRGYTRVITTFIALETTTADQESAIALTIVLLAIVFLLNFLADFIQKRLEGIR